MTELINKNIEIIFEDENYLILNKPAGIMVHPDGKSSEYTVCDFLLEKYPGIENVGEPLKIKKNKESEEFILISRPGIVHRTDKETSGILLVAKNQKSFEFYKDKFQNREIEKTYHTFIYGNIKEDSFIINEPIGRSRKDFRQFKSGKNTRGEKRSAETHFTVLKRSVQKNLTMLEARPKTGRTHQIRVHLNFIYKPILGDKLYAPKREVGLGFKRLALHAKSLKFVNQNGEQVSYEVDYPEDFKNALNSFV